MLMWWNMDIFDRDVMRETVTKKNSTWTENRIRCKSLSKIFALLCFSFQSSCNQNIVNETSFFHKIEPFSSTEAGQSKSQVTGDVNYYQMLWTALHLRPLRECFYRNALLRECSCAFVHNIDQSSFFFTVCDVEVTSITTDPAPPIFLYSHESTWAEEIQSSGSCAVDSGCAWSNTAEGTVQSAGSYEPVQIPWTPDILSRYWMI